MELGIRLHDVNNAAPEEEKTLEARARKAKEEGFLCVHLALSKCVAGTVFDADALTEGLGAYLKRLFAKEELDIAVLGCYLNLAHPAPEKLKEIQSRYFGSLRVASLAGAGMVGTETGCPNAEYKTDPNTHSGEALRQLIKNLEPVAECAEHYGVTLAIEPVWSHIVYDADRALEVLRSIGSPNLRIIFDPVNLLSAESLEDRDRILADAMEKLSEHIAVVHLKDYQRTGEGLLSCAAGTGEMDYREILRFLKAKKPYIQATLENTSNETAQTSRLMLERLYAEV